MNSDLSHLKQLQTIIVENLNDESRAKSKISTCFWREQNRELKWKPPKCFHSDIAIRNYLGSMCTEGILKIFKEKS